MATRGSNISGSSGRKRGQPFANNRAGRGSPNVSRIGVYRSGQQVGNGARGDQEEMSSLVHEGIYSNKAMVHTLTSMTGLLVQVKMVDGVLYEGILKTVSPEMDVVLELAHKKIPSQFVAPMSQIINKLQLSWTKIVSVSALSQYNQQTVGKDIFRTDPEVRGYSNGHNAPYELKPFFDGDEPDHGIAGLDDANSDKGWGAEEMFKTNQDKFQVKSSFNAEMPEYTVKLDKDDSETFIKRAQKADKLASEIESQDKFRHGIDDTGTEEEQFSAVVRENPATHAPTMATQASPVTTEAPPILKSTETISQSLDQEIIDLCGVVTATTEPDDSVKTVQGNSEEMSDVRKTESQEMVSKQVATVENTSTGRMVNEGTPIEGVADEELSGVVMKKKEDAIKKFQLNPNAKEFNPNALSSLPSINALESGVGMLAPSPLDTGTAHTPTIANQSRGRSYRVPRNTPRPTSSVSSGYNPSQDQLQYSYVTNSVVSPLQSPGQLVPNQIPQYSPLGATGTSLASPTGAAGMIVRPPGYAPPVMGQVQQQFTSTSPISFHPSHRHSSALLFPPVSSQAHVSAVLAPPFGTGFQGQQFIYMPNPGNTQGFLPTQPMTLQGALTGLHFPQSQGK